MVPPKTSDIPDSAGPSGAGAAGDFFIGKSEEVTPPQRYQPQRLKRVGRTRPRLQPPLMPLIDVTFMLLLFFITTMQFSPPEGQIQAQLPSGLAAASVGQEGTAAAISPLEPLRVYLRAGSAGAVDIEVERYAGAIGSFDALRDVFQSLRATFGSGDVPIIIQPAVGVSWQHALDALRQAQLAGFKDIAFAYQQ
jgi:biopolymer transport protein ExbD